MENDAPVVGPDAPTANSKIRVHGAGRGPQISTLCFLHATPLWLYSVFRSQLSRIYFILTFQALPAKSTFRGPERNPASCHHETKSGMQDFGSLRSVRGNPKSEIRNPAVTRIRSVMGQKNRTTDLMSTKRTAQMERF